jgi:hypothetical protein
MSYPYPWAEKFLFSIIPVNKYGEKRRALVSVMVLNFLDSAFPPAIVDLTPNAVAVFPIMLVALGGAFENIVQNEEIHDVVHIVVPVRIQSR